MAYHVAPLPPKCPKCGKLMRPLHTGMWPYSDGVTVTLMLWWWYCRGCKVQKATGSK